MHLSLNPVVSVTVVSAIISALVSVIVAWLFGERRVAQETLIEERRRSHHLSLVSLPMDLLVKELRNWKGAVSLDHVKLPAFVTGKLMNFEEKADSSIEEIDLLLAHLKSGYPEIFRKVLTFERAYALNSLQLTTLASEVRDYLRQRFKFVELDVKTTQTQTEFCDYGMSVFEFFTDTLRAWELDRKEWSEIKVQRVNVGNSVRFQVEWGWRLLISSNEEKANEFKDLLAEMRQSKFRGKIIEIFEENTKLAEMSKDIERDLVQQRIFTTVGVPLKGECAAGKEAQPRLE